MEEEYDAKPGVNRKEKKLYWHTRLGKIEIAEQIFTHGRESLRSDPFPNLPEPLKKQANHYRVFADWQ
jgi:hypothetical protein